MWRPPNWKTLEAQNHPLHCFAPDACVGQSYEAGADAMLETLRGKGYKIVSGIHEEFAYWNNYPLNPNVLSGTIVFIPDEEK